MAFRLSFAGSLWNSVLSSRSRRTVLASVCAFILPLAVAMNIYFTPTVSLQEEMQLIAALNVIIAQEVLEARERVASAENSVEAMAAYHQMREISAISMELAAHAMDEQIAMSSRSRQILRQFRGEVMSMLNGGDFVALGE